MYSYRICLLLYFLNNCCSCCPRTFTNSCVFVCNPNKYCDHTTVNACIDHGLEEMDALSSLRTYESEPLKIALIKIKDKVAQFRSGAFNNLSRLEEINADTIGLMDLFPNCFQNLPNIKTFRANHNYVEYIPVGVFSGLPFIEIQLTYNNILRIKKGAFNDMNKLERLYLNNNKLTKLDVNAFKNTTNIKYLSFSHNKITHISVRFFEKLTNLRELDLSFNNIVEVASRIFNQLTFLSTLVLSSNNIKYLDMDFFAHNTTIDYFNIAMNNITYIDMRLLNKLKIKLLMLFPNPLSCPCMYRIMEWAGRNNVEVKHVLDTYDTNGDMIMYPACIAPSEKNECTHYDEVFHKDSHEYFRNFNYTKELGKFYDDSYDSREPEYHGICL